MTRTTITFDSSAQVYEVWTLAHEWLGCADTMSEARQMAIDWELSTCGAENHL